MEPYNGMKLHIVIGQWADGKPAHDGKVYELHEYDEGSGYGWACLPGNYPFGYAVHRDYMLPVEVEA